MIYIIGLIICCLATYFEEDISNYIKYLYHRYYLKDGWFIYTSAKMKVGELVKFETNEKDFIILYIDKDFKTYIVKYGK